MSDEVQVILDLSRDVQMLLDQQEVDFYEELQGAIPSLLFERQTDPLSPRGSRGDIVTVITVTTGLMGTLTPIILRILNMITPPNRSEEWIVEETETRYPDGSTTIHRRRVLSKREQRLSEGSLGQRQTRNSPLSPPPGEATEK